MASVQQDLNNFILFLSIEKKSTNFGNKYIQDYCPPDLPWYERDGLLTWYNQNKYAEFSKNPDEYLKNKNVINFDMIIAQCRGDNRQYSDKHYQTVVINHVKKILQREKKRALGASFHSERKDVNVEKNLALSHFLDKEK